MNVGFDFNKALQSDLEEANKSILQLNKSLHLARMEKENSAEEISIMKKKII